MKCKKFAIVFILGALLTIGVCTSDVQAAKKNYTKKDLKYMSCIIWAEAGNQSYAGKLAVGCVVMNRKRASAFPNSVKGVIYQRGQFAPTWDGAMHRALKSYQRGAFRSGAKKQCVKAAKAALSGQSYVVSKGRKINMRRMHFFNRSLSHAKLRIQGHAFK